MEFEIARQNMVESQLRPNGVTNPRILSAFEAVARERFVKELDRGLAYAECECGLAENRFILSPLTFGRLLQLADIAPSDFVLDVGAASGYSTAVLAHIAESVVSLECIDELCELATENLSALDITNAATVCGPLNAGAKKQGPFDVIILNGCVPSVSNSWVDQLNPDGRVVAVVGDGGAARLSVFQRIGDELVAGEYFTGTASSLPGFEDRPTAFSF